MPHRGPDQGGRQELRWCWPRQDSWKPAALVWGLSGEYDPTWVLPPPLTFFRHSWLRLGVRHRGRTESPPRAGHFSFEVTTLLPSCENLFGERAGQTDKAVIWEGVSDKTGPVEWGRGGQSTCCPLYLSCQTGAPGAGGGRGGAGRGEAGPLSVRSLAKQHRWCPGGELATPMVLWPSTKSVLVLAPTPQGVRGQPGSFHRQPSHLAGEKPGPQRPLRWAAEAGGKPGGGGLVSPISIPFSHSSPGGDF